MVTKIWLLRVFWDLLLTNHLYKRAPGSLLTLNRINLKLCSPQILGSGLEPLMDKSLHSCPNIYLILDTTALHRSGLVWSQCNAPSKY